LIFRSKIEKANVYLKSAAAREDMEKWWWLWQKGSDGWDQWLHSAIYSLSTTVIVKTAKYNVNWCETTLLDADFTLADTLDGACFDMEGTGGTVVVVKSLSDVVELVFTVAIAAHIPDADVTFVKSAWSSISLSLRSWFTAESNGLEFATSPTFGVASASSEM
jgi:hypothetical protein